MFHKNNKNPHFLQKLTNREISGNFIRQGKSNCQSSSTSKLFKTIPSRCAYQLKNVIDLPGNHVFMGTTRCGQFLLTYSFITHTARSTLSQRNKYQLHWWLFRPGRRAAKVAEVQLFADYAVTSILTIGIAQWPTVNQRLVVYGFCNNAEDYLEEDHRRYYLTITTLPSLNCRDCSTVAASFDEEDMAANWDSCVSFSCLKHGLTIHSLFDVTPPYPKFDFNISLKLNNSVVFNTVNFLHVLSIDFENPKPEKAPKNEQTIVNEEINHRVGHIMTAKYPKEYALPYDINKAFKAGNSLAKHVMKQTQPHLLPPTTQPPRAATMLHTREKSSRQWCIRIPNLAMKPVSIRTKVWRRSIIDQAEKVYAFEESEDGGCEPKFKWYRRKRLADKMYEFCSDEDDEDMENIRPPDKCGTKLPRYKCLSPPKAPSQKCDVIENRLSQSESSIQQQPFTKMILNIGASDTRYKIQNTDCCKRLMTFKTDADSEIRNEMKKNTTADNYNSSTKSNNKLDETCCDISHRDMDSLKSNSSLDGTSCDIQQRDMDSLKSNPSLDETSSNIQHLDMDSLKSNSRLDENGCDKQQQDMAKPVTIQIPPINLPLCVTDDNNCAKNLHPVFVTPAVVRYSVDKVSNSRDAVSNPLPDVVSLLDTVPMIHGSSVSDSTSSIHDISNDTVSTSSAICNKRLVDTVSDSSTIPQPSTDTVSDTLSEIHDISNDNVTSSSTISADILSDASSTNTDNSNVSKSTVSNSASTNTGKRDVSYDTVSNSSSTINDNRNVCNTSNDAVSNSSSTINDNRNVCKTSNDTVSNLKGTFEPSNINHDIRAIIAEWEADSVSSMSPQSEFSSSVTTCNSPKVSDFSLEICSDNNNERDMTIQRFLEIPPRFGFSAMKKNFHHNHHHRLPNITSNLSDFGLKVLNSSNATRCAPTCLSTSAQYPPIKLRALQPHNRIRRNCFKPNLLPSPPFCFGYEKEEELKRKKGVGSSNKIEGDRRKEFGISGGAANKSEADFEVKRRREGKLGSCSGGANKNEKVDNLDFKRRKKETTDGSSSSLEEELVDILDNIVGRRMISDCSIQLDRRFIEVDEEMISTITDIEDDDQAVGFHCALPLHVHGSAYAQMQMVSNHKVDKLNVPCVLVRQNSLDIEQLCSKAAEVICECEGFKFWFCDDYDTEIVEVCPLDGSILIVVFMRLNVERVTNAGAGFTQAIVVDQRHFYECKCLFIWSTAKQECSLEAYTHLRSVPVPGPANVDGWSPAGKEAERMRRRAEAGLFHLKPTPPIRAFVHRLYDDDDNQTDSALEVQDPTNLMLFRLYPFNNSIKINSNRIVVL